MSSSSSHNNDDDNNIIIEELDFIPRLDNTSIGKLSDEIVKAIHLKNLDEILNILRSAQDQRFDIEAAILQAFRRIHEKDTDFILIKTMSLNNKISNSLDLELLLTAYALWNRCAMNQTASPSLISLVDKTRISLDKYLITSIDTTRLNKNICSNIFTAYCKMMELIRRHGSDTLHGNLAWRNFGSATYTMFLLLWHIHGKQSVEWDRAQYQLDRMFSFIYEHVILAPNNRMQFITEYLKRATMSRIAPDYTKEIATLIICTTGEFLENPSMYHTGFHQSLLPQISIALQIVFIMDPQENTGVNYLRIHKREIETEECLRRCRDAIGKYFITMLHHAVRTVSSSNHVNTLLRLCFIALGESSNHWRSMLTSMSQPEFMGPNRINEITAALLRGIHISLSVEYQKSAFDGECVLYLTGICTALEQIADVSSINSRQDEDFEFTISTYVSRIILLAFCITKSKQLVHIPLDSLWTTKNKLWRVFQKFYDLYPDSNPTSWVALAAIALGSDDSNWRGLAYRVAFNLMGRDSKAQPTICQRFLETWHYAYIDGGIPPWIYDVDKNADCRSDPEPFANDHIDDLVTLLLEEKSQSRAEPLSFAIVAQQMQKLREDIGVRHRASILSRRIFDDEAPDALVLASFMEQCAESFAILMESDNPSKDACDTPCLTEINTRQDYEILMNRAKNTTRIDGALGPRLKALDSIIKIFTTMNSKRALLCASYYWAQAGHWAAEGTDYWESAQAFLESARLLEDVHSLKDVVRKLVTMAGDILHSEDRKPILNSANSVEALTRFTCPGEYFTSFYFLVGMPSLVSSRVFGENTELFAIRVTQRTDHCHGFDEAEERLIRRLYSHTGLSYLAGCPTVQVTEKSTEHAIRFISPEKTSFWVRRLWPVTEQFPTRVHYPSAFVILPRENLSEELPCNHVVINAHACKSISSIVSCTPVSARYLVHGMDRHFFDKFGMPILSDGEPAFELPHIERITENGSFESEPRPHADTPLSPHAPNYPPPEVMLIQQSERMVERFLKAPTKQSPWVLGNISSDTGKLHVINPALDVSQNESELAYSFDDSRSKHLSSRALRQQSRLKNAIRDRQIWFPILLAQPTNGWVGAYIRMALSNTNLALSTHTTEEVNSESLNTHGPSDADSFHSEEPCVQIFSRREEKNGREISSIELMKSIPLERALVSEINAWGTMKIQDQDTQTTFKFHSDQHAFLSMVFEEFQSSI